MALFKPVDFGNVERGNLRLEIREPLDPGLWQTTLERLPFLSGLTDDQRTRLRETVILFLHQKSIRGAAGLELDSAMRLMIAAQACILILNLDIDYYRGWVEVIVYPDEFVPAFEYTDEAGVVHTDRAPRAGEAWLRGPLILSWVDVAPNAADKLTGEILGKRVAEYAVKLKK